MRVIDSHVHLYSPEVNLDPSGWAASRQETNWLMMATRRRKNGTAVQTFPSLDQLIREMDSAGVAKAILLGWYWQHHDTCVHHNRFYGECVRAFPDRLAAFAAIQPHAGVSATVSEMNRARDDGLVGLGELSPHSQHYAISHPAFEAALNLAISFGWLVNLHVTDPNCREYPGKVETPLADFLSLARTWPKLRFILAHWGGLLPMRDAEARAVPNIFYDTAASPLLYDATVWKRILAVVPTDRILFGSDFPLNLYPKLDREPRMHRLIDEARSEHLPESVLGSNAERLLDDNGRAETH
jgi:predicted TIM-barrel fold metal-dependent hydrolase